MKFFFYLFAIYIYSMPPGSQGDTISHPVINKNFFFFLAKHSYSIFLNVLGLILVKKNEEVFLFDWNTCPRLL